MEIKHMKIIGDELFKIRLEISRAVKLEEKKVLVEENKKTQVDDVEWRKVPDLSESARYPLVSYNLKKLNVI